MTDNIFRKNLLNCLTKNNMTQGDIASKVGVSKSTVSMWCNGLTKPRGTTLVKLAKCLSVTPAMLLSENDTFFLLDEEKLLHDFRMLSPKGKEKAMERMEELKQLYWYDKERIAK